MNYTVLKKIFTENIGLKLFSLLISGILWFIVMGEQGTELQVNIPLELINTPADLVIVGDIPEEISLKVLGPSTLVRAIAAKGLRYTIDLSGIQEGIADFKILAARIKLPRDITTTRISPSSIQIKFEQVKSKKVRVNPVIEGNPPDGFSLLDLTMNPPEIMVSGARSQIHRLQEISTEPVDISREEGTFSTGVGLDFADMDVWQSDPKEKLEISFRIEEKIVSRTLKGFPLEILSSKRKFTVKPERIDLVIDGPYTKMETLKPQDVRALIDISELRAGVYYIPARISLPEGLVLNSATPEQFKVRLMGKKSKR